MSVFTDALLFMTLYSSDIADSHGVYEPQAISLIIEARSRQTSYALQRSVTTAA